jgi:hypothetical protein
VVDDHGVGLVVSGVGVLLPSSLPMTTDSGSLSF